MIRKKRSSHERDQRMKKNIAILGTGSDVGKNILKRRVMHLTVLKRFMTGLFWKAQGPVPKST